jgi:hypothetical protein
MLSLYTVLCLSALEDAELDPRAKFEKIYFLFLCRRKGGSVTAGNLGGRPICLLSWLSHKVKIGFTLSQSYPSRGVLTPNPDSTSVSPTNQAAENQIPRHTRITIGYSRQGVASKRMSYTVSLNWLHRRRSIHVHLITPKNDHDLKQSNETEWNNYHARINQHRERDWLCTKEPCVQKIRQTQPLKSNSRNFTRILSAYLTSQHDAHALCTQECCIVPSVQVRPSLTVLAATHFLLPSISNSIDSAIISRFRSHMSMHHPINSNFLTFETYCRFMQCINLGSL